MGFKERIIKLVQDNDIRLGQDFCVNDPVDYNQTKGVISGLNMAISEYEKEKAPENVFLKEELFLWLEYYSNHLKNNLKQAEQNGIHLGEGKKFWEGGVYECDFILHHLKAWGPVIVTIELRREQKNGR